MIVHDRSYRRTSVIRADRSYSYTYRAVMTFVALYNWLRKFSSLRSSSRWLFGSEVEVALTTAESTLSGMPQLGSLLGALVTEKPGTLPVCLFFFEDVAERMQRLQINMGGAVESLCSTASSETITCT